MHKIGSLLSGLFLTLVFVVSISFSYFNTTPVSINFGSWQWSAQPISVWIIGAFVSGGAIGLLLGMGLIRSLKSKAEIRRLNKQLSEVKQELNQLQTKSLKDLQ